MINVLLWILEINGGKPLPNHFHNGFVFHNHNNTCNYRISSALCITKRQKGSIFFVGENVFIQKFSAEWFLSSIKCRKIFYRLESLEYRTNRIQMIQLCTRHMVTSSNIATTTIMKALNSVGSLFVFL